MKAKNNKFNKLIQKGRLNGQEIKELAKMVGINVDIFEYDLLPKKLKEGNYIILLGKGSGHWTALYVRKYTSAYYDSFGVPPPEEIYKALGKKIIFFFDDEEQHLNMNHCGQFCVRFLYKVNNPNEELL